MTEVSGDALSHTLSVPVGTYYVAMTVTDNQGNASGLSNEVTLVAPGTGDTGIGDTATGTDTGTGTGTGTDTGTGTGTGTDAGTGDTATGTDTGTGIDTGTGDTGTGTDTGAGDTGTDTGTAEPPTVQLSVSDTSPAVGTSVTISWSSTAATSCQASGGWSGNQSLSGQQATDSITGAVTYTLSCANAVGSTQIGRAHV